MTVHLWDHTTGDSLGLVDLAVLPRVGEYIARKRATYQVVAVVHTNQDQTNLIVTPGTPKTAKQF